MTSDESGSSSDDASDLVSELEDEDSELESGLEDEMVPVIGRSGPLAPGTGFGNSPMSMGQNGRDTSRPPHKGLHGSRGMLPPGLGGPHFPEMQPQATGSPGKLSLPFAGMTAGQSMPGFDMGKPGNHPQVKSTKAGKAPKMSKLPQMESIKPMKPGTRPAIHSGHIPSTSRTQIPQGKQAGGTSSFSTPQMPSLQSGCRYHR